MTTSARRMNRLIITKRAANVWLATSMTLAFAGCGPLEELVEQVGRHPGGRGSGGVSGGSGPGCGGETTTPCGPKTCGAGTVCCNASCGICNAPGMACTQQGCIGTDGGTGPAPETLCLSSSECRAGELCTAGTGECLQPPGCSVPGTVCPAVCYGRCQPSAQPKPVQCGSAVCEAGLECCNASCGTCVKPGGSCTQQACVPPAPPTKCQTNADCRAFSDYCTGCDCRALASGDANPVCAGPGVLCIADPCTNRVAVCVNGACDLVTTRK